MSKALEMLIAGRAVIADPKCWTRGAGAFDATGRVVASTSPWATRWCSYGALKRGSDCTYYNEVAPAMDLLDRVAGLDRWGNMIGIIGLNDNPKTTHAQILEAWDKAIEMARKEEEGIGK